MADWDLSAVVRSCTSAKSANNRQTVDPACNEKAEKEEEEPPLACLASLTFEDDDTGGLFSFADLSHPKNCGSLHDSYMPFLPAATNSNTNTQDFVDPPSSSSIPAVSTSQDHCNYSQLQPPAVTSGIVPPPLTSASPPLFFFPQPLNEQQPQLVHPPNQLHHRPSAVVPRATLPQPPRSRKRKSQQKRTVTHVTADNLSSDPWAWRKYGQKPIKGSPYPRNYYRCSSSKGCSARKQVERSNLDSNMYVVTYTGDHTHQRPTHRNSLAGSTRNKVGSAQKSAAEVTEGSCSSLLSDTGPTPAPGEASSSRNAELEDRSVDNKTEDMVVGEEEVDVESDEDDDVLIPNKVVDDDLFKGLEQLSGGGDGGLGQSPAFGDKFSSWGDGSSAAAGAAAGSG